MTFFFYDLETSGFSPREQRIMQFAGQRTDLTMQPIGEPFNVLIKLTEDILPDPDAVLLTGITPQMTLADGMSEADFLRLFHEEIAVPETIFVGYNTIRFDDEFMRFLHYRNYYDAYEWHWADKRSRWDMLDVVRMTRALRPEGIKWPFDSSGKPSNRLELLTSVNKLDHAHAHDALSDVKATIAIAKLIHAKQPKLFEHLLDMRSKDAVKRLVNKNQPFVYTSGKYEARYEKTTVVSPVCNDQHESGVVVFDLRQDPTPYLTLSSKEIAAQWKHFCKERPCPHPRIPLKTLQFNRCPAVAPLGVLTEENQQRLELNLAVIEKHHRIIRANPAFCRLVRQAVDILDKDQQMRLLQDALEVDARLYDTFVSSKDKQAMRKVRIASEAELRDLQVTFSDDRLEALLPLYKARNYLGSLHDEERAEWERFKQRRLLSGKAESRAAKYFERLAQLAERSDLTGSQRYLLEELQLYGQSVLPFSDE
jgi:exodeoxyribonuclease-1